MILTDREIKNSLASGLIDISPRPEADAYDSTSVDLTLDANIREFNETNTGLSVAIDPGSPGFKARDLLSNITSSKLLYEDQYKLIPKKLILAWTRERVHLKSLGRVAARVEGKSSLARMGLAIHVTAPTIHSGFEGTIQLEIINHGPLPIILRPGMHICQLILGATTGMPDKAYKGQFLGQGTT
ncbi:dCTP deaminase [Roseixanthobacter liquoris]|uniref:dCTP deaminase n=1 Tax=Roseixanthobacter liquoris TaxID=3119921 RepID=UPI003726D48E